MKRVWQHALPVLALFAVSSPALRADATFNFETNTVGTTTPFTDTNNGVSATFSSSSDPGGFLVIGVSTFDTLTGKVLIDNPSTNRTLAIQFSSLQSAISLDFATDSPGGVLFDLDAFDGGTQVGSVTAIGSIPLGFTFPEGIISFSGAEFDSVVLSAPTAPAFAIDNVTVTGVPEPTSLPVSVLALGVLALVWRRPVRS